MIKKIRYKTFTYAGKVEYFVEEHEFPDFQEKPWSFELSGKKIEGVDSVESQIMNFLDNMDKKKFMDKNDIHTIIDYEIFKPKKKVNKKKMVLQESKKYFDKEYWIDFAVIYTEMYKSIRNLPWKKQFEITVSAFSTTVQGKLATAKEFSEIIFADLETLEKRTEGRNQKLLSHE